MNRTLTEEGHEPCRKIGARTMMLHLSNRPKPFFLVPWLVAATAAGGGGGGRGGGVAASRDFLRRGTPFSLVSFQTAAATSNGPLPQQQHQEILRSRNHRRKQKNGHLMLHRESMGILRAQPLFSVASPYSPSPCSSTRHLSSTKSFTEQPTEGEDDSIKNSNGDLVVSSAEEVERRTRLWLKRIVVGLNLCPFADLKKVKIEVVPEIDEEEILNRILGVMLERRDKPGTTLVVCPGCKPDNFNAYLDVMNMVERGLIQDYNLEGIIQVAPFHPAFQFEGGGSFDDWTNRAPYPIFHVLREEEVAQAVDKIEDGDAGKVWKRNVDLLLALGDELGTDSFEKYFRCDDPVDDGRPAGDDINDQVRKVLRKFPVKLS